ncbi:alpha/beta fold hydrolase [Gordonia crocea]|uniref:Alpha/beta hydrolase n=1 Tax=Gordonia crocea TaxID=589162 RepID=A0A7M3SVN0_9ACTN|nr:alpha/beta hydrolase [Gordonia crocea]GED96704.1 alpha/beta hydrolase [Gordonia crocea]
MSRRLVTTDDGIGLSVVVEGAPGAETSVVFCHGWTLDSTLWSDVVGGALPALGESAALIRYDMRGHGRSSAGVRGTASIERLAADLACVIEECAPVGDVILVGHSLGGMTLMAFAQQWPQVFDERVVGTLLVATSAGDLWDPVKRIPGFIAAAPAVLRLGSPSRLRANPLTRFGLRYGLFGGTARRHDLDATVAAMRSVDRDTYADLGQALLQHDRAGILPAFATKNTVVFAGSSDHLTPARHGRRIAEAIPGALYIESPGAGHMIPIERATDVIREVVSVARAAQADPARREAVSA